jgi:Zn-dependent protease
MFPDFSNPDVLRASLVKMVSLILAVTVHEYCHALAAYRLGDDFAARQGRLTLNPLAHADPLGTVILPLFVGFGWGKPVPYVPQHLTRKISLRAGEAIIAFAGPLANVVLAFVCAGLLVGLTHFDVIAYRSAFGHLLHVGLVLNLTLFFFNLLPVPPLDGSKIAAWVFGRRADALLDRLQGMGALGFVLVVLFGGAIVSPAVQASSELMLGAFLSLT